jgi:hypothetical protein
MLDAEAHSGTTSESVVFSTANTDPTLAELGLDHPAQVSGVFTADLSGYAGLTNDPAKITVTIGDDGPYEVSIHGAPADLDGLTAALQIGIRNAHDSIGFTTAQVFRIDNRLLVLSGTTGNMISFSPAGVDPAISEAGLLAPDHVRGVFSSDLSGFAGLTNDPAVVRFKIGTQGPHEISIAGHPADLNTTAAELQNGIRTAYSNMVFTGARVLISGNRLLVIHGIKQISFSRSGVAAGVYLFRSQVDGAISALKTDAAGRYIGPTVTVP